MPSGVTISTNVSYLGELFQTVKRPNTLLKYLGGLRGGALIFLVDLSRAGLWPGSLFKYLKMSGWRWG